MASADDEDVGEEVKGNVAEHTCAIKINSFVFVVIFIRTVQRSFSSSVPRKIRCYHNFQSI